MAALLAATAGARANVTVLEDKVAWYEVSGATVSELRASLDANTPVKGFDAETKWWVDWRYRWKPDGQNCALTNVEVMLRVETTFPRLGSEQRPPVEVLGKWRDYSDRLMAHERNHARHGAQAAADIYATLAAFTVAGACSGIEDNANAAAMKLIRKANQADEDYDRRTDHGATEGVVLQ